jgi:hypothetical protein
MIRRLTLLALMMGALAGQYGCGLVAAGAAGAVIGHEAAEDDDD